MHVIPTKSRNELESGREKYPKVLFILHLPPPVHGAAMVGQFIRDSRLVKETFDSAFINLQTARKISDIGKGFFKKLFSFVKIYWRVARALSMNKYDLVYMSINAKGPAFYKEIIIVFLAKLFGHKLVYHYHNKGIIEVQDQWLPDLLYRFQFKQAKVIHLSPLLYADIEKYVAKDQVYFLPNGIPDQSGIDLSEHQSVKLLKPVVEILYLSNMMKVKGVYVLLEAYKLLHQRNIHFKAIFAGATADISEEDFNDAVMRHGLEGKVAYVGKKYGAEKRACFESADVFAFPPVGHDLFPLVTLEAMQYGIPIVSTDEGAIPEIVEDGREGFIVPKNNPTALADKLELLITHPELRLQMGAKGRMKYEAKYTIDRFEHGLVTTLRQVLSDFSGAVHENLKQVNGSS